MRRYSLIGLFLFVGFGMQPLQAQSVRRNAPTVSPKTRPLVGNGVPVGSAAPSLSPYQGFSIGDATMVRLSAGGMGHIRYLLSADQVPKWSRAMDTEMYIRVTANSQLGAELRLHILRPDLQAGVSTSSTYVLPRFLLRSQFDTPWQGMVGDITLGMQRRRGLGRSLLVKDVLSDGVDVTLRWQGGRLGAMWFNHVMTKADSMAVLDFALGGGDTEWGILVLGGRPHWMVSGFDMGMAGIYGGIPLIGGVVLATEWLVATVSGNATPGLGGLLSLTKRIELPGFFGGISVVATQYDANFNAWLAHRTLNQSPIMTLYPSLLDEEFDYGNYRTTIAKGGFGMPLFSLGVRAKVDWEMWSGTWLFVDSEFNQITTGTIIKDEVFFGSSGLKFSWTPHHFWYIAVQNRFSVSDQVNSPLLNQPTLTKLTPSLLTGVKFRF